MDPKPGRRVGSAFTSDLPGDFSYTVAVKDGANPDNIPVNHPSLDEATTLYGLAFRCPACGRYRAFALDVPDHAQKAGPKWGWNGDQDKPTCTPSIKAVRHGVRPQCGFHGYITNGVWTFCADSACDPIGPDEEWGLRKPAAA